MGLMNNYEEIAKNILSVMSENQMIVTAVILAAAIMAAFFGVKIFRAVMTIAGLLGGAAAGFWILTELFRQQAVAGLIAGAAVGIILAVVFAKFYALSAMLGSGIMAAAAAMILVQPKGLVWILVCAGIGFIPALISLKFREPIVILTTSMAGGMGASVCIARLARMDEGTWTVYAMGLGIAVIGLIIQFVFEGRKKGRQAAATARTIRSEKSIENEIEAARLIISDDDEE